jgi:hypothetical protein
LYGRSGAEVYASLMLTCTSTPVIHISCHSYLSTRATLQSQAVTFLVYAPPFLAPPPPRSAYRRIPYASHPEVPWRSVLSITSRLPAVPHLPTSNSKKEDMEQPESDQGIESSDAAPPVHTCTASVKARTARDNQRRETETTAGSARRARSAIRSTDKRQGHT